VPKRKSPARAAQYTSVARDDAKQETREALIRAGMDLFAEQGLDVPSLDAVCAKAGFTRGAFYVHFKDREELIVAVMESATGRFVDAVLSARGQAHGVGDIVAAFAASVRGGSFAAFGDVPVHQFLAACARSSALRERYLRLLIQVRSRLTEATRADQLAGKVRRDADPELIAGLLLAVALGVGTMTAIEVPFDPSAHAGALMGLLTTSGRPRRQPAAGRGRKR
jgi:AcrR family transcriptional regulator